MFVAYYRKNKLFQKKKISLECTDRILRQVPTKTTMFVGSLCHLSPQISVILPLPIVDIMAMVQQYVPSNHVATSDGSFRPKQNFSWSEHC